MTLADRLRQGTFVARGDEVERTMRWKSGISIRSHTMLQNENIDFGISYEISRIPYILFAMPSGLFYDAVLKGAFWLTSSAWIDAYP